jgi:UDP-N-acetylmuramyl pentapeptide phosphotransferase/UDP-N-acetylglucosamine-1-phosphate transferase
MALTSLTETKLDLTVLLAALSSSTIIAIIGLIDDINIDLENIIREETNRPEFELELNQKIAEIDTPHKVIHEKISVVLSDDKKSEQLHREGLSQIPKMMFVLPALLPLIAVGAGSWTMTIPIINYTINWGLIYPLILMPGGFLFVTNSVNMLAGTNGLSTGMAAVTSASIGIFALINGQIESAAIALSITAPTTAFLKYNKHPASILPGDSFTYLAGAAIFSAVVIGNIEKFGATLFTLYVVEFFLKARSKFQAQSWGILQKDGTLKPQHDKIYSLTHPLMNKKLTEKQITQTLVATQTIWCTLMLIFHTYVI